MFRSALERPASWLIGEESGGMPETRASDGTGFVLLVMPDKLAAVALRQADRPVPDGAGLLAKVDPLIRFEPR